MTEKPTGGPAFPELLLAQSSEGRLITHTNGGMTLRDWFAGQAMMPTLLLALEIVKSDPRGVNRWTEADLSEGAYKFADAMLAERSKP